MVIKKVDMNQERDLVMYMITSTNFCKVLAPIIKPEYLATRYAAVVVQWVMEYYEKYKVAPGKFIQELYNDKKSTLYSEDEKEAVVNFLISLSDHYDDISSDTNIEPRIDTAIKYLKIRSLENLKDTLQKNIIENTPDKGEQVVASFTRVGKPEGDCYSVTGSVEEVLEAFLNEDETALTFPDALGKVVGPCYRGDLIAFLGGPKKGKTSALLYTAEIALKDQKKCLYVSLEMQKPKIIRKFWQSLNSAPLDDATVKVPFFTDDVNGKFTIEYKDIQYKGIDLQNVAKVQKQLKLLFRGGDCKFISMPSSSTTVENIETVLDNLLYYDNFNTDILIIDYADLLGGKEREYRHKLNDIWANLKRISQERNILTITASQTNRAGMGEKDLTSDDIAEDIRKAAHVSKLIALNQSKENKLAQVMRWKILFERDVPYTYDEACTLQCLSLGKFCLDSRFQELCLK